MAELNKQITGTEKYALKRLRETISVSDAISLLQAIGRISFQDNQEFRYSFPDVFQNVSQTSLYITTKNRKKMIEKGENPGFFLFKSDFAFLFSDLTKKFGKKLEDFDGSSEYKFLKNIIIFCDENDQELEITNSADLHLNNLLTDWVLRTARFVIEVIEKEDEEEEEKPEEEQDETEEKKSKEEKKEKIGGTLPQQQEDEVDAGGDSSTDSQESVSQDDELEVKEILFSDKMRTQSTLFVEIALNELETHYGLPKGTLQNSIELRELLQKRTTDFFLTVIGDGKHNDLLSPETKLLLVREYIWLIQNDTKAKATISFHLEEVLERNKDPKLKERIEQALREADEEDREKVDELISNIVKKSELTSNLSEVEEAIKAERGNNDTDFLNKELIELIETEFNRIGIHPDRVPLQKQNVMNIIDVLIKRGNSGNIMYYFSNEERWRSLFGDEIPYDTEFLESLKKAIDERKSYKARTTENILLLNDAIFVIQEAENFLNESPEISGLTKEESDEVFEHAVAAPARRLLVDIKAAPVKDAEEVIDLVYGESQPTISEKQEIFYQQVWEAKDRDTKAGILEALGYGEADSKVVQNIIDDKTFHPKEMGLHDMAPLFGPAFYDQSQQDNSGSTYIPSDARLRSPLSGIRGFRNKTKGIKNLKKGIKGAGKKLSKKAAKEAAKKAAEKAAEAGLSTAASTATGAIHPALGFLTKLATTKKGRKALVVIGGVGIGSLIVPLTTIGGWIGGTIGTIAGGLLGGPGGALAGGIGGSWLGFGIEKGLKSLFGGGSSSTIQAGGLGQIGANLGQSAATQAATASQAAQAAAAAPTYNLGITTFQPTSFMGQSLVHIGGQAVLGTAAVVAGGSVLIHSTISTALLANFPVVDPLGAVSGTIPGKESEYVSIEKRAFIAGCPENKCENPAFPLKVEYAIEIKPKGNYTIQILDATDTLKVNHSDKAWEENEGRKPPSIPDRVKNLSDFEELYEEMILEPGESVALNYSETLSSDYNHSSVLNTFDLKVFAKDPETGVEGTDNAITGEVVYIGDYSQGAGCWPSSGTITQLPGGSYSHGRVDAFDIASPNSPTVFTPFSGKACPGNLHPGYGIHVVLTDTEHGTFVFGHFQSTNIKSCVDVVAGQVLGIMGNTGNSSGPHLHFELRGSAPNSGALPSLMPDGSSIKVNDPVRTCYE